MATKLLLPIFCFLFLQPVFSQSGHLIGTGIYDITGPAVEVGMMGYAKLGQVTEGIHTRLYSRAFIVADPAHPNKRIVFVNADLGMGSQAIKIKVVEALKKEFGDLYTDHNVAISGTHTHS